MPKIRAIAPFILCIISIWIDLHLDWRMARVRNIGRGEVRLRQKIVYGFSSDCLFLRSLVKHSVGSSVWFRADWSWVFNSLALEFWYYFGLKLAQFPPEYLIKFNNLSNKAIGNSPPAFPLLLIVPRILAFSYIAQPIRALRNPSLGFWRLFLTLRIRPAVRLHPRLIAFRPDVLPICISAMFSRLPKKAE